jgi:hypothetical protein
MKDKVTITLVLEREPNGTITRMQRLEGEGFHLFELVGLLQMSCYELAKKSIKTAVDLPKDKNVRIKFESDLSLRPSDSQTTDNT